MKAPTSSIAIIPARGGSKRIPRKNIRLFRGRPIMAWSIEAAIHSGLFNVVMVSTDDEEIAKIAVRCGAEVPFLRSKSTAGDFATTADVLHEVLDRYAQRGLEYETACCIYPTAPLLSSKDLIIGRNHLISGDFDVVLPVAAFTYPIWRSLSRHQDGRVVLNFPENVNARSQDIPSAFHDAGQWYWFKTQTFMKTRVLLGSNTGSIVLPATRVQDIDNQDDWEMAELKHERIYRSESLDGVWHGSE